MSATKFITKHYRELNDHPVYGINAVPLETNIKEWCGNVFFPRNSAYPGLILHFRLYFDDQYPSTSPYLELRTNIDHTHVFFPRCCFSLLPDFRGYFESVQLSKTAYWNPTRTVRNFLESFYQFLVYDVDRESHGRQPVRRDQIEAALKDASNFGCDRCGHSFNKPSPPCPDITEEASNKYDEEKMGKGEALTEEQQAIADFKCSISGKTIAETVMGFGVDVQEARNGKQITTDIFPLSYESFYKDGVRVSAGGARITHWIPFAINEEHWKKALPLARESIAKIWVGNPNQFRPEMVLEVIGELWKTKAVEMMKGEEHASEKVLVGFCTFHHLLLAFAQSYPDLIKLATDRIASFISSPDNRNKKACPDFGRFLPSFLISDILWDDKQEAGKTCIAELFTRNAMWILKDNPDLSNPKNDSNRVDRSWGPSQVGLKLTCFQIRYIIEVGRPSDETDINKNWIRLSKLLGRPTQQMIQSFQQTVKKVQAINNYLSWFEAMGIKVETREVVLKMLQDAMSESARQGYHKSGGGNNNNYRGGGGGGGRGSGRRY